MNEITQFGNPGALANRQRASVMDDMGTGLGTSRGAHISLKSGRFKLVNAAGMETPVQSLSLDVIVIAASPVVNRILYGHYDPTLESPPICFSDNGRGPSVNVVSPQWPVCETCPNNVRGSGTTFTGKPTTACQRRKKLAVILPGDPAVNVYELQVPPASLTPLGEYRDWIKRQGNPPGWSRPVDIADFITRVEWSTEKQFVLTFRPVGWASDERTQQVIAHIDDNHLADAAIGLNDQAWDPQQVADRLQQLPAQTVPTAASAPQQFQLPPAPQMFGQPGPALPPSTLGGAHHQFRGAHHEFQPQPQPQVYAPQVPAQPYNGGQQAPAAPHGAQEAPAPAKRTRGPNKPKAPPQQLAPPANVISAPAFQHPEMAAAPMPIQPGPQNMPPMPAFVPGPQTRLQEQAGFNPAPPMPSHGMSQPMAPPPGVSEALQQAMNLRRHQ